MYANHTHAERPRRRTRWSRRGAAALVAAGLVAAMVASRPRSAPPGRVHTFGQPGRLVTQAAASPTPCPPPPLPAATIPPAAPYGIPFVAQITGTILSGYDPYVAIHGVPANHGDPTPWRASLTNITGWAAGLLQVPSLAATIAPTSLVFCGAGLVPSQGGIVLALLQQQLAGQPYFVPVSNQDANCSPTVESYQDDRITLTPTAPTTFSVSGVEPDGSLDLTGTAAAMTKIDFYVHGCGQPAPPTPTQTCIQFAPTTVTLSTRVAPPPPTAPPGITYPLPAQGLQGPLPPAGTQPPPATATASLVSNNFAVPAFIDAQDQVPGGCFLAGEFNGPLSGYNSNGPGETTQYPSTFAPGAQPQTAAQPGWVEFGSTTKIVQLGS